MIVEKINFHTDQGFSLHQAGGGGQVGLASPVFHSFRIKCAGTYLQSAPQKSML